MLVANPGSGPEEDGVLLAVGSHKREERAVLAIIDAKTMTLVASASVPRAIPLGFHGSFLRETPPVAV